MYCINPIPPPESHTELQRIMYCWHFILLVRSELSYTYWQPWGGPVLEWRQQIPPPSGKIGSSKYSYHAQLSGNRAFHGAHRTAISYLHIYHNQELIESCSDKDNTCPNKVLHQTTDNKFISSVEMTALINWVNDSIFWIVHTFWTRIVISVIKYIEVDSRTINRNRYSTSNLVTSPETSTAFTSPEQLLTGERKYIRKGGSRVVPGGGWVRFGYRPWNFAPHHFILSVPTKIGTRGESQM